MANNIFEKDHKILYNSVPDQRLTYANQLTIKNWNDIINILKVQANINADYMEKLHNWLIGSYDSTKPFEENIVSIPEDKNFAEYILELIEAAESELERLNKIKADKQYVDDVDKNLLTSIEQLNKIKADKQYVDDVDKNLLTSIEQLKQLKADLTYVNELKQKVNKYFDLGSLSENPLMTDNTKLNSITTSGLYTFYYAGKQYLMLVDAGGVTLRQVIISKQWDGKLNYIERFYREGWIITNYDLATTKDLEAKADLTYVNELKQLKADLTYVNELKQKVNNITDLGVIQKSPMVEDNDTLNNINANGLYTFVHGDIAYLMLSSLHPFNETVQVTRHLIFYLNPANSNVSCITRLIAIDGTITVISQEMAEVSYMHSQLALKVDKSDLTKDYYKKSVVDSMINSLTRLTLRKIYSLPEVGEPNVIYLLADSSGKQNDCTEYLYIDGQWELIGSTEVDLSGYVQDQDVTIRNETATSKTVGGITAGTVLKGKTVLEVLEDILYPYVAFSVSISGVSPNNSPYEKGTSVNIKGITVKITPGSKPVTNIKLYESDKTTLLGEKTSDISTNNTFAVDKVATSSVSFYVEASDGTNTFNTTTSFLSFYYPTFYGVLDTGYSLTSSLITGKTKVLKANKNNTFTYTATNQHPFVAFPASYGNLTSIKDSSNLEYIGDFVKTTMNLNVTGGTVSYNIYVLKDPTDISDYKFIFS